jgi:hypothetical protein
MNYPDNMPELYSVYGYKSVWVVIGTFVGVILLAFISAGTSVHVHHVRIVKLLFYAAVPR